MTPRAYVGLGANLGAPVSQVGWALAELADLGLCAASSLYRTEPLGDPAQPWYVNAVAELELGPSPEELLRALQSLETRAGRPRIRASGAARVLDLDLLLWADRILVSPELTLPHPQLQRRRFVLEPLAELAPGARDPRDGRTALELLAALDDPLRVEKLPPKPPGPGAPRSEATPRLGRPLEVWQR